MRGGHRRRVGIGRTCPGDRAAPDCQRFVSKGDGMSEQNLAARVRAALERW